MFVGRMKNPDEQYVHCIERNWGCSLKALPMFVGNTNMWHIWTRH